MFGHPLGPLGMPQGPSSPYRIPAREERVGVGVPHVDYSLNFPVRAGEHNWLVVMHLPQPAEALRAGGFALRLHRLAGLHAYCWVCERDFDEHIVEGPCLGDPYGREIPTRAQFREWSDVQKIAWMDEWAARGPGRS